MTVKEIVKKYLGENGYDGLYCNGKCACKLSNLTDYCEDPTDCKPGYKHECDTCDLSDDECTDTEDRYPGGWCIREDKQ